MDEIERAATRDEGYDSDDSVVVAALDRVRAELAAMRPGHFAPNTNRSPRPGCILRRGSASAPQRQNQRRGMRAQPIRGTACRADFRRVQPGSRCRTWTTLGADRRDTADGSTVCGDSSGIENWTAPTSYQLTVQALRSQLPISHDYYGLPFCSQEYNGKLGLTQWDWADASNSIVVVVKNDGTVTIIRQPDDEGRQGCDSP